MATFAAGKSGNKLGRPKGSVSMSTKLFNALEGDVPALIQVAKEKALDGDTAALKLLLDRLYPAKRPQAEVVFIEGLKEASTLTERAKLIVDAVGDGKIPPDVGQGLVATIGSLAKIIETDELLKRVEALESA
jgi:hypothetical protein